MFNVYQVLLCTCVCNPVDVHLFVCIKSVVVRLFFVRLLLYQVTVFVSSCVFLSVCYVFLSAADR